MFFKCFICRAIGAPLIYIFKVGKFLVFFFDKNYQIKVNFLQVGMTPWNRLLFPEVRFLKYVYCQFT